MGVPTTAVIVTYNSRGVITECLDEAERAHLAGDLEVIVVDNDSQDGTPDHIRERYPWVRVIESGANIGFGRGCNLGIAEVKTEYALLLNPDAVLPVESLRALVAFMERTPHALMSAPATKKYGGSQWQSAGGLPTPLTILRSALGRSGHPSFQRCISPGEPPFKTDWLGGGILLTRCAGVRRLGGFDSRFFLYFDETDLCRRAIDAGHELWAIGTATGRHACGTAAAATGETLYRASIASHYFRSRFYYMVKHFGWSAAVVTEVMELAILAARSLTKKAMGRGGHELAERLSGPVLRMPDRPVSMPQVVAGWDAIPNRRAPGRLASANAMSVAGPNGRASRPAAESAAHRGGPTPTAPKRA